MTITKFHKQLYFPDTKQLKEFSDKINMIPWKITEHAKNQIFDRIKDITKFTKFITEVKLKYEDIIEYNRVDGNIKKCVYRLPFSDLMDICISINNEKRIITLWFNNVYDNHNTLNVNEYCTITTEV